MTVSCGANCLVIARRLGEALKMDSMRHAVHTVFKSAAEKVMPTRSESGFHKHGVWVLLQEPDMFSSTEFRSILRMCANVQVLTPEEFVRSGDYLVGTCSTWTW